VEVAVNRMLSRGVGRLPVVRKEAPTRLVGYLSRTSLLSTRLRAVHQETVREDGWFSRTPARRP
jgi:CIC family chloride channel protein